MKTTTTDTLGGEADAVDGDAFALRRFGQIKVGLQTDDEAATRRPGLKDGALALNDAGEHGLGKR